MNIIYTFPSPTPPTAQRASRRRRRTGPLLGAPAGTFLIFWLFETRFKFCFAKTLKKQGKYRILTSQNRSQTPSKSNQNRRPQKHRNFHRFSIDFAACCKSQTFIFVRMAIVLLGFYTIHAFAFGMRFGSQNPAPNPSKTRPEPFKH